MTPLRTAIVLPFLVGAVALRAAEGPQEPRSTPYSIDHVDLQLAGTLTVPQTGGPFPAALLLRGPGAESRDDSRSETGPFLALVDHLTRRGIAVMQVDLRGVGDADRGPATTTTRQLTRDVRDGVTFLQSHRRIDPQRIGLIGHGEGASVAVMMAAANPDIAFTVLMAAAGVPGDEFLLRQFTTLAREQGASDALIERDREIRARVFALIGSEPDGVAHAGRRRALVEELTNVQTADEKERTTRLLERLFAAASTPWFRFFLSYNPRPDLMRLRAPLLAVTGEDDLQAAAAVNLPAIREALEAAGNRDVTIASMPGLNHLLQDGESAIMAPAALNLVSDWIRARTAAR